MRAKTVVKRILRTVGLRKPKPAWVMPVDRPADPDPLPSFGLFAIVVTWMEADVIAATVRNAFAQGCDHVLLVDNDSPGDTVAEAMCAGAELAPVVLDPAARRAVQDQAVEPGRGRGVTGRRPRAHLVALAGRRRVRARTGRPHAAGVPHPLDRSYRIVGTRYFNHFPDHKPESLPGFHPLDLQPLCQEKHGNLCREGHRKHPAPALRPVRSPITCGIGYHAATCSQILLEPTDTTFTHHFPYRLEATTRLRSETLCGRDGAGCPGSRPTTRWCVATPGPCPTCRSGSARSTTSTPRNGVSSRTSAARARRSAWSHGRGRPWSTRPTPIRPLVRAGRARLGARVRAGPGVNDPAAAEFRRHRRHAVGIDVALQVPARPPADLHAA